MSSLKLNCKRQTIVIIQQRDTCNKLQLQSVKVMSKSLEEESCPLIQKTQDLTSSHLLVKHLQEHSLCPDSTTACSSKLRLDLK